MNAHQPGDLNIETDHGMSWMMKADMINQENICFDKHALETADLISNAPVLYQNKCIGNLHTIHYNKRDGFLIGHFSLTNSKQVIKDCFYLYAIPLYDFHQIKCIRCETIFRQGNVSCDCIINAPIIQIPQITISGMIFCHGLNDDISVINTKEKILHRFFGGIIASIQIQPEEF